MTKTNLADVNNYLWFVLAVSVKKFADTNISTTEKIEFIDLI